MSRHYSRGTLDSQLDETKHTQNMLMPRPQPVKSPERRSPLCSRGRTMREFEEELVELRRENFDLKMRIYILEEQRDQIHGVSSIEELHKVNVELTQEMAELKKDLADKEELILHAAKAMELLEAKQKEALYNLEAKAMKDREKMSSTIMHLEQELKCVKNGVGEYNTNSKFNDSSAMYAMAFGLQPMKSAIQEAADDQMTALEIQIAKLENQLIEETRRRSEAEEFTEKLQNDLMALQEAHNTTQEELAVHIDKLRTVDNELHMKKMLITSLEAQMYQLEATIKGMEPERGVRKEHALETELHKSIQSSDWSPRKELEMDVNNICAENVKLQQMVKDLKGQAERRHRWNTGDMESLEKENARKEDELRLLRAENSKAIKALQGFMKQNKCLMKEVESLKSGRSKSTDPEAGPPTDRLGRLVSESGFETDRSDEV